VSVIYLGVGDHFRPCDRARASLRVSTLLGLKRPYILFVGNLKPHKNVRTLLRAFAEIRVRKNLDHHLLILGDDRKWKASLVSECGQLGIKEHVHFVPQAAYEELPWVYGAADLFVMPSLIEGFGLPVLEAMACGTPVVCSRAASLPEVGGNAVDYFDPSSEDDLAAALERVLGSHELQQTLRCRGFERVKLFPWSQTARQTLDLYRSVLHEP